MTIDDDDDLAARIRAYTERHGMNFKPWQIAPWDADDGPCPFPAGTAGAESWPQAQRLRRQIIKALKAEPGGV